MLAGLIAYVAGAPTQELFGRVHFDDGVLFSSAKALAEGDGYVIANVPGSPPQTKYPILYPWLLSLVWRLNPSFPENVDWAVWINALFGCMFLVSSFLYLRRQPGVGEWSAIACVALTATYTRFLDLSASLMSDVPFMALAITALLLAEISTERPRPAWSAWAGVAAGLAYLTRTAGIAFVAAIVLAALAKRDWRRAGALTLGSAPFVLAHQTWNAQSKSSAAEGAERGWVQLWAYMTSYTDFWQLSTPNLDVLADMVNANISSLAVAPAQMALFPAPTSIGPFFGFLLGVSLSAAIISGLVRQARGTGWGAVHTALTLTTALSLLWNFPIISRLLAVFLPVFCMGALVEARHIASMASATIRSGRPVMEKALSGGVLTAVGFAGMFTIWTHAQAPLRLKASVAGAARASASKGDLYRWIEQNAAPTDLVLAYADCRLYLETGRLSAWPAAFTTDVLYGGEKALEEQFDHYLDTARHLKARYLVVGPDEIATDTAVGKRRLAELRRDLPVVFSTDGGAVKIYDLSSLHTASRAVSRLPSR